CAFTLSSFFSRALRATSLFPSTTLFRSIPAAAATLKPTQSRIVVHRGLRRIEVFRGSKRLLHAKVAVGAPGRETPLGEFYVTARSEEHTSELQSHLNLVCRLLLEIKHTL